MLNFLRNIERIRMICSDYRLRVVAVVLVLLPLAILYWGSSNQTPREEDTARPMSRPPIAYKSTSVTMAAQQLSVPPEDTVEAHSALKFFNGWMTDAVFRTFFYYTHEFFDHKPEAFPAARFVSLALLFDESADNFYLMKWTQAELQKYSSEIMDTLERKVDLLDANPYFHNRMLNLVNQLDIPSSRRVAFWGDTIQRPIVLLKDGEPDDSSHNFEIALLLVRQEDETGNAIAPYVKKLLDTKPGPAELAVIRERVEGLFPHLGWMFLGEGNGEI